MSDYDPDSLGFDEDLAASRSAKVQRPAARDRLAAKVGKKYIPTALRKTTKKPRPVTFAVGIEHRPDEFGMTHGPVAHVMDMLEVVPDSQRACILRFNADWTEDVIWRWGDSCWEKVTKGKKRKKT